MENFQHKKMVQKLALSSSTDLTKLLHKFLTKLIKSPKLRFALGSVIIRLLNDPLKRPINLMRACHMGVWKGLKGPYKPIRLDYNLRDLKHLIT